MTWYFAVFLGLLQGLTEFLPVSSSGHLAIFQNFFGMADVEQSYMLFDVLLHLGTLIAVCAAFWKDIVEMVRAIFTRGPEGAGERRAPLRLFFLLVVATLPLVVTVLVKDFVEGLFSNTVFVGCALMVTGLALYLSDRAKSGGKNEKSMTVPDALAVGIAQMAAVVPGLSRSGMTISAGLSRKLDRSFAIRFSFLMSLPAIAGANLLSLVDAVRQQADLSQMPVWMLGVAAAAVSGYLAIGFMKRLAKKGGFKGFSWYCLAVGAVVVILTLAGV